MRYLLIAALFPLFALGSATAPAEQAPDPVSIQPGQWEIVTEMTSVEAPGAPEEMLQQMRASMADQRQVQSQCITPEEARNPSANMMGSSNPSDCLFSQTTWAGGNFGIRAACRPAGAPPNMAPVQVSVAGTYAARQIDGRVDVTTEVESGAEAPVRIQIQGGMTGRRTGECATPDPRANENSIAPAN